MGRTNFKNYCSAGEYSESEKLRNILWSVRFPIFNSNIKGEKMSHILQKCEYKIYISYSFIYPFTCQSHVDSMKLSECWGTERDVATIQLLDILNHFCSLNSPVTYLFSTALPNPARMTQLIRMGGGGRNHSI